MPFAFGHLIGAWLLGKGYELLSKKKISHAAWFFLLFGAILPDADFLIDWTLGTDIHRTLTHSLLFVIGAPLLVYGAGRLLQKEESKYLAMALGAGICSHLFLDFFSKAGVPLLWPKMLFFSPTYIGPELPGSLFNSTFLHEKLRWAVADMALGTAWLFYLWWKKRVQF